MRNVVFGMKIASWNVNSVRKRLPNLLTYLGEAKPDILGLQELKCEQGDFPLAEIVSAGYEAHILGQKAYNGVAVLYRHCEGGQPPKQSSDMDSTTSWIASPAARNDPNEQARYIEIETSGIRIVNIYAPNGNPVESEKFTYKLDWLGRLERRIKTLLRDEVPFLVMGDFNIIPEEKDAHTPAAWAGDALFRPESRAMYRRMVNLGLTDAFRMFEDGPGHYTFWDYQAASWAKNDGIRIDHILLSPQLADRAQNCRIVKDERGRETPSDHVPIEISISMPSKAGS